MESTTIWLVASLCFTGFGTLVICYWAPHCPMPANPCRRFILIAPLHDDDPWDEKKNEKDEKVPWWFSIAVYCVVMSCMVWPVMGWALLLCIAMWMMYRFIQKITETGRYAQPEQPE